MGLKVYAPKSKLCAEKTEYLGYILTKDGIKPQPNKELAILALTPPKGVKDFGRFLGMVQTIEIFGQGIAKCLLHSPH